MVDGATSLSVFRHTATLTGWEVCDKFHIVLLPGFAFRGNVPWAVRLGMIRYKHGLLRRGVSTLAFQPPVENYKGHILEVALGDLSMGGEAAFPYHPFEGAMPNGPLVAFEVWDEAPEDWSPVLNDVYGDVYGDPVAWAGWWPSTEPICCICA